MVPVTLPPAAGGLTVQLTPDQAKAVNSLFAAAAATSNPNLAKLAAGYAVFMVSASSGALNGIDFGAVAAGATGGFLHPGPGAQFPIPVACPAGQPVNNGATCSNFGVYVPPLPASFAPLNGVRGNYPALEKTTLWSARIDQIWTTPNKSSLPLAFPPPLVTALPS